MAEHKHLSEGGAKDSGSGLGSGENEALQKESRQAVKNQGEATPDDYPEGHEQN